MAVAKKKPVVDAAKRMQEALEEHEEMLKIYKLDFRCAGCKKFVSPDWDACPNCGGTEALLPDEA